MLNTLYLICNIFINRLNAFYLFTYIYYFSFERKNRVYRNIYYIYPYSIVYLNISESYCACYSSFKKMAETKYVSSWYNLHSKVPESYVQPLDRRPCNAVMSTNKTIPVIDLAGNDRDEIVKNIIKSSEEYGFFQVSVHAYARVCSLVR